MYYHLPQILIQSLTTTKTKTPQSTKPTIIDTTIPIYFPYLSNISNLTQAQIYTIAATLTIIPIKLNISLFNYDTIYELPL